MMAIFRGYRCSICGRDFGPQEVTYTCPQDGGNLDVILNLERIRASVSPETISAGAEHSIWRYLPLLPVEDPGHAGTALRSVGGTPLFRSRRLAGQLGLSALWIKDDGRNPTASFKDRASAVAVARAQEIEAATMVTASTGNAGAALAGMAAAAGRPAIILAPRTAPPAKVAQLLIFGAHVILVDGTYDQAFDLTLQASAAFGWYCRNTGYNPFTAEGKKTAALEICEQLTRELDGNPSSGEWMAPDAVFVSVGDGNIISGVHKGFSDLLELGWIGRLPRLYGIQSSGSAAIYHAFAAGKETITPVQAATIADSISVDLPRDGLRALRAARQTGGAFLQVDDQDILLAMRELGGEAIFAEPAGAAGFAGLKQAVERGLVKSDERIVVLVTGSGLKDVRAAMLAAGEAAVIEPSLDALSRLVQEMDRYART
jgi:threonine synthase